MSQRQLSKNTDGWNNFIFHLDLGALEGNPTPSMQAVLFSK